MMAKILDGRLTNRAGKTYLQLADNQEVPLTAAASSVKELAPFMQALKNHSLKHFSILFEEPEAHVHPIKQQTLADVIACCMNKGTMFQITTHSDYLLSRFNQLIRLGNLKKKNEEAFKTYCQTYQYAESLFLDGSHINAYYFQRAGKNVQIKRLDTTNGIPFDTFGKAIDRQVEEDDRLENFLNEINHEHYK